MSVLVEGMEMPKTCCACFCARGNECGITRYEPTFAEWYEDGVKDCPLIPVPPHGRLIDADALEEHDGWLRDSMYFAQESSHTHIQFIYANDIINAPTVIEAEEGE